MTELIEINRENIVPFLRYLTLPGFVGADGWTAVGAFADGEAVGAAEMRFDDDMAEIRGVSVSPDFRARGVGTALLAKLRELLGGRAAQAVWIGENPAAEKMFRKVGFTAAEGGGSCIIKLGQLYIPRILSVQPSPHIVRASDFMVGIDMIAEYAPPELRAYAEGIGSDSIDNKATLVYLSQQQGKGAVILGAIAATSDGEGTHSIPFAYVREGAPKTAFIQMIASAVRALKDEGVPPEDELSFALARGEMADMMLRVLSEAGIEYKYRKFYGYTLTGKAKPDGAV